MQSVGDTAAVDVDHAALHLGIVVRESDRGQHRAEHEVPGAKKMPALMHQENAGAVRLDPVPVPGNQGSHARRVAVVLIGGKAGRLLLQSTIGRLGEVGAMKDSKSDLKVRATRPKSGSSGLERSTVPSDSCWGTGEGHA